MTQPRRPAESVAFSALIGLPRPGRAGAKTRGQGRRAIEHRRLTKMLPPVDPPSSRAAVDRCMQSTASNPRGRTGQARLAGPSRTRQGRGGRLMRVWLAWIWGEALGSRAGPGHFLHGAFRPGPRWCPSRTGYLALRGLGGGSTKPSQTTSAPSIFRASSRSAGWPAGDRRARSGVSRVGHQS
jgi:hypothetical protein